MKSAIIALRHGGRVSLWVGFIGGGDPSLEGYALGIGVEGKVDVF